MSTIFDNSNNKIKCQKFTPAHLAETMLDIVGYTRGVHGKKILENSFGSGNILAIVVRRYIEDCIHAGLTPEAISDNLSKDIYGIELDKDLYKQCMDRLDRIVSEYNIPSVHWALFNENALTWDTALYFDYIVGNPPYINYKDIDFRSKVKDGVDIYTRVVINYPHATSCATLGIGVKTEGNMVISGTKGYVYVPAPWWLTSFFEVRYEDQTKNRKYFYSYDGEGLRYEIQEFVSMIVNRRKSSYKLKAEESIAIAGIIEKFHNKENYTEI